MTRDQILHTALEALEYYRNDEDLDWIRIGEEFHPTPAKAAITTIRSALAQHTEPADVVFEDNNGAARNTPQECQRFGADGVPAAVWVGKRRYVPESKDANELLISAAPELLEALKTVVANAPDPYCAITRAIDAQCRAAIAKAEGKE